MSSPKIKLNPGAKVSVKVASRTAKPAGNAAAAVRAATKPKAVAETGASIEAKRLAAAIQRELGEGRIDMLSPEALQSLIAALCNTYAAQIEAGGKFTPVPEGSVVSPTAVMVTASGLLRAANLAVFELGMWQSWTGR
jgi:hypothetical protein